MVLTIPFSTGVVAAFIFLISELLVFPVLMYATSTLASFSVFKRAIKGERVQVRSIPYPFWSEGLFHHQPAHVLLFLLRVVCIIIPVYLETRFVSRSSPILVPKLLQNAYVPAPKDLDGNVSYEEVAPAVDTELIPLEVFTRCTSLDDDGWVTAKLANITVARGAVQTIKCVPGTDKVLYRTVERFLPAVEASPVENKDFNDTAPANQLNLTLQVVRNEGPLRTFPQKPVFGNEGADRKYFQVKNVTVLDSEEIECFSWRAPLPDGPIRIYEYMLGMFMCQSVNGRLVDFYFASIVHMTNESNTRILSRTGSIVSKQFTVATTFNLVGSLEFQDKIMLNAGNVIRRLTRIPPISANTFPMIVRTMLYTRASNVTVEVPGEEEAYFVDLDRVVVVVGAIEVISVVVLGMVLAFFSRCRWSDLQRTNTVQGLSYIWAESRACMVNCSQRAPITLQLKRHEFRGQQRLVYDAVDVESGMTLGMNESTDEDSFAYIGK